jgi:hypothetical protein
VQDEIIEKDSDIQVVVDKPHFASEEKAITKNRERSIWEIWQFLRWVLNINERFSHCPGIG